MFFPFPDIQLQWLCSDSSLQNLYKHCWSKKCIANFTWMLAWKQLSSLCLPEGTKSLPECTKFCFSGLSLTAQTGPQESLQSVPPTLPTSPLFVSHSAPLLHSGSSRSKVFLLFIFIWILQADFSVSHSTSSRVYQNLEDSWMLYAKSWLHWGLCARVNLMQNYRASRHTVSTGWETSKEVRGILTL